MAEQGPTPNDQDNRWQRHSKTLALWVLLFLVSVLAINFVRGQDEAAVELQYRPEFLEQVRSGNVSEVTVIGEKRIEGEFRQSINREGQDFHSFEVMLPPEPMVGNLYQLLEEQNVRIQAEEDGGGWAPIVMGALPWLIIIAFWIWIFRAMQSGGNRAFQFGRS